MDWAGLPETAAPTRPDGFVYAFEVTRGSGQQERAVLTEPVPAEVGPLLAALLERARLEPPDAADR
ncbi:MAG: hypothetical protein JWN17_1048 [Frankiales bacterium]|nr:hypothetical protein [Frankiales bacterium]